MNINSFKRFLIVWAGQLFSGLGTGMTAYAIGVRVFEQTQSATGFAAVMLAIFVPSIVLVPLGGVLADRFDRRAMIIIGDAGSALSVVFLMTCLISGRLSLLCIYLGVAVGSAFSALQSPAYKASLKDLLSEAQYAKAGGLIQLASSARHLIAPAAGGLILSLSGIKTIFLFDIASFAVAVAAVLCLPVKNNRITKIEKQSLFIDLKEGWIDLSANMMVKAVISRLAVITFFAGCVQTLFTPMLLSITDVKTLGAVQSVSAIGMIAGSLIISVFGLKSNIPRQLRIGFAAGGLSLALLGSSINIVIITIFFFLFYLSLPLINTSAELLIRTEVASEKQGRIWGITGFLTQTGYITAYLSAGFFCDRIITPILLNNRNLANLIGPLSGDVPGRESAFILVLCGLGMIITALFKLNKKKGSIKNEIKLAV